MTCEDVDASVNITHFVKHKDSRLGQNHSGVKFYGKSFNPATPELNFTRAMNTLSDGIATCNL